MKVVVMLRLEVEAKDPDEAAQLVKREVEASSLSNNPRVTRADCWPVER